MRRARLARLCDSAWRVRCTPARLNIATTITEDPIVPSPQSRCRWRSARPGRNYKFPFARSGIGYDRVRERARPAGAGTGTISFAIRGSRSAPRARVPVRLVRSRAHPLPHERAKRGQNRGVVLRRNLRWNPSRRGTSRRHTVSSHAPGAGRGKPLSVRMTRRRRGFTRSLLRQICLLAGRGKVRAVGLG